MSDSVKSFPLSDARTGQTVELISLTFNGPTALRLAELGLVPHTEVQVLRARPGQPMLLSVRESRLALDRRLARKVLVQAVTGPLPAEPRAGRGGWMRRLRRRRRRGRTRG